MPAPNAESLDREATISLVEEVGKWADAQLHWR